MNIRTKKNVSQPRWIAALAGLLIGVTGAAGADVDVSQSPLYVGSNVPGNLALVPSVEYPTVISKANLSDTYSTTTKWVGYFDSKKCYKYNYSATDADNYFYPVRSLGTTATTFTCGQAGEWSGNFLNWAATQTIDPFRSALTGGYRVTDTPTTTILEKATMPNANATSNFPRRSIAGKTTLQGATPSQGTTGTAWSNFYMKIDGQGNKMLFGSSAMTNDSAWNSTTIKTVPYNPSLHVLNGGSYLNRDGTAACSQNCTADTAFTYYVYVRAKVCVSGLLEDNCVQYSQGYKPEGLLQEYSKKIRYSVFSYRLDNSGTADSGVLRARQKFIGPNSYYPDQGTVANTAKEWDPTTGVIYTNPDTADATATTAVVGKTIPNSGVLNYINKFGQTGNGLKTYDDVSELYYAAIRYFKHLGNVTSYSDLGSGNADAKYKQADAFPVITSWDDPIKYWCQTNVILGIGDTNTHWDKNLPGATNTSGEPAKPALVTSDNTVDVVARMKQIFRMEGSSDADATTKSKAASFNSGGNNNSAYIAALAYDAHTKDMRADFDGKQTLSTHWVDVVEYGDYKTAGTNQYWLATKYGGFTVPAGYDPETNVTPLADSTWWDGSSLVNNANGYKRPSNYYLAADAARMVASLRTAFERILDEMKGSASSLASNTTKLEAGAMTYQSIFYSGTWRGDVVGYNVNPSTGALTQAWGANDHFPAWASRNINFAKNGVLTAFNQTNLAGTALASASTNQVNYLRGERTNEGAAAPSLRVRTGVMGDIVNSQPVYVGAPNARLYVGASFAGATGYAGFAAARATRTPTIYVGANDGMLHAFNANTGAETFAFVPKAAMTNLLAYTSPTYEHRYYVDGELTVSDVFDTSTSTWRSILVGTMGRGGRGAFALDVTDPANIAVLWDETSADITGLGNNLGKPIIGQLADGQWYAMLGNGPNSTDGTAQLVLIEALTGTATSIDTGAGPDNGLSGVLAWSSNNNYIVDRIYAGDLLGNLWRFDMSGSSGDAELLFSAVHGSTAQPITAAPAAARDPSTGLTWVYFGTGKYLSDGDLSNKDVQTWYGLIDRGSEIPSDHSTLRAVDIVDEGAVNGYTARVIESVNAPGQDGWYMDLLPPSDDPQGERMVVSNFFQGTALIGTTRIPDAGDVCSPSGKGFVMAINPFTGGRLTQSFFDFDGSGGSSTGDTLNGAPASGIGLASSPNNPIFLGNVMQVGLDNASTVSIGTNSSALSMRRVSWRELLRND